MKQFLGLFIVTLLLASEQVFGATDEEVQQAYTELTQVINDKVYELQEKVNNASAQLKANLDADASNGSLALQEKLKKVSEKITMMAARANAFENSDVSECGQQLVIDTLANYSAALETKLITCAYGTRYTTGRNFISAYWTDIAHYGVDYMSCADREIQACKGDEACNDKILAGITQSKEDSLNTLGLLGVDLLNSVDSFSYKCKDQVLIDFDNYSSDMLEYFRSCVERVTKSFAPVICS